MKKLLAAAAISAIATTSVTAGAYSDPIIETITIVEDTSSSGNHGWVAPALFILLIIAATR